MFFILLIISVLKLFFELTCIVLAKDDRHIKQCQQRKLFNKTIFGKDNVAFVFYLI